MQRQGRVPFVPNGRLATMGIALGVLFGIGCASFPFVLAWLFGSAAKERDRPPVECQVPAHPTAASNVLKSRRAFDWAEDEAL